MGNPSRSDLRWSQHATDECPTAFERFTKPCIPKAIQSCGAQEIASTPSRAIWLRRTLLRALVPSVTGYRDTFSIYSISRT
jgi:hypothetical protein